MARPLVLPALLVTLVLAVAGCSEEAQEVSASGEGVSSLTDEACADVLADDVLAGLGWTAEAPPVATAGRCEVDADAGTLVVGRVPTAGAAREAYDESCDELTSAEGEVSLSVDWLPEGLIGCVATPAVDTGGSVALYVLEEDQGLLEVVGSATAPAPTAEQWRDVLADLAQRGSSTL